MTREQIESLVPGSIVRSPRNKYRTVLTVNRGRNGQVRSVVFPILHCSWTKRPYTYVDVHSLFSFELVEGHIEIEKVDLLKKACEDIEDPHVRRIRCCDVIGVIT